MALHREKGMSVSEARDVVSHINDETIDLAVKTVAKEKGVKAPGGGAILQELLDFLNAHWADILAVILKLIGI